MAGSKRAAFAKAAPVLAQAEARLEAHRAGRHHGDPTCPLCAERTDVEGRKAG